MSDTNASDPGVLNPTVNANAALEFQSVGDWSNAATSWQLAIDTLPPGANPTVAASYRAQLANAIAQSRLFTIQGT